VNAFPPGPRRRAARQRRKACGSMLAARDVHPRVTMQILRHSKSAIMMKIYTNPRKLHQTGAFALVAW